jgi:hypothetical protein
MQNEFKEIPGYSNYKVNQLGEVYSLNRKRNLNPISMKMQNGNVSKVVFISGDREPRKGLYVHNLVASTFLPNPNNWKYVGHKDKNLLNNHVDNLYWREKKNENRSPMQRLTPEQALDIYSLTQNRKSYELLFIANMFDVQFQTVYKIKNKKLWASLHK